MGGGEGSPKKTAAELGCKLMSADPKVMSLLHSMSGPHWVTSAFLPVVWFPASPDIRDAIQCLTDCLFSPRVLSSFQSLLP